jgi:hypothetical protein
VRRNPLHCKFPLRESHRTFDQRKQIVRAAPQRAQVSLIPNGRCTV